mmetsp:Transcript_8897/g.22932  ORF Transcript_8897/g.22932 Transcript_8897/m.22932 type:complete len:268 (+) Transcript_8897:266-1069(+)
MGVSSLTTPAECMTMQLSASCDNALSARAVARWTDVSADRRYSTIGATAPVSPNSRRLVPHVQHSQMAVANWHRKRLSVVWTRRLSRGTTPWSVITARFSESLAIEDTAAHVDARTSICSERRRPTTSSSPPTNERTSSPALAAYSIHGQMAHAAPAWTSAFSDLSSDHKKRTPSPELMAAIESLSPAHDPTAFVTFTSSSSSVDASNLTSWSMPPALRTAFRATALPAASSEIAPVTLMRTRSGWFCRSGVSPSTAFASTSASLHS